MIYLGDPKQFVDRILDTLHAPTAVGDRIDAGQRHDRLPLLDGTEKDDFSPLARAHPDISTALDEVRLQARVRPDTAWLESVGFTFQRSNIPRRRSLSADYGCDEPDCHCGNTGGHRLTEVLPFGEVNPVSQFRSGTGVSVKDPHGVREVHLHDPNAPSFTPTLPWKWSDGGVVTPSLVAFPVMYGYSTERIARAVMELFATGCFWQDSAVTVARPAGARATCTGAPDSGLVVAAGTTTHLFPVCNSCRWAFGKDVTPEGWEHGYVEEDGRLNYVVNDGWDRAAGYPADEHR